MKKALLFVLALAVISVGVDAQGTPPDQQQFQPGQILTTPDGEQVEFVRYDEQGNAVVRPVTTQDEDIGSVFRDVEDQLWRLVGFDLDGEGQFRRWGGKWTLRTDEDEYQGTSRDITDSEEFTARLKNGWECTVEWFGGTGLAGKSRYVTCLQHGAKQGARTLMGCSEDEPTAEFYLDFATAPSYDWFAPMNESRSLIRVNCNFSFDEQKVRRRD